MKNANNLVSGERRNDNAEWAILKEMARSRTVNRLSWKKDFERAPDERERYREIGAKLLRVISRMPDKPSADEKAARLDRIHRLATNLGVGEDLEDALIRGQETSFVLKVGNETFKDGADLTEEELQRVEQLRNRVVDLTEVSEGALASAFPSRNYLFHGAVVDRLEKVFATGELKNGVALQEDNPDISAGSFNSGFEGISWSLNGIDALPGTRGHLAGFLAAPEDILSDDKLVVPSRPAPYEVLQISGNMDQNRLYWLKTQAETWGTGEVTLGEVNNVDSNLMFMLMESKGVGSVGIPSAYQYEGSLEADELRKFYTIDDHGMVLWDEDIQQKNEVPPVLPWLQAIVDSGRLQRSGYEGLDSVEDVLAYARGNRDFILTLLATERKDAKPVIEACNKMFDEANAIRIKPEEMYFVAPHKDLDAWLRVMARTNVYPKGILLYDDEQVIMENFASNYEGNHAELSEEIGRAIGVDSSFWSGKMGMEPHTMPRSGYRQQVVLESAVKRDKAIMLKGGELVVE